MTDGAAHKKMERVTRRVHLEQLIASLTIYFLSNIIEMRGKFDEENRNHLARTAFSGN